MPGAMEPGLPTPGAVQPNPFALDPGIIGGRRRGLGRVDRPGARGFTRSNVSGPASLPSPLPMDQNFEEPGEGPPAGDVAELVDDEGPANGLTLDAALERLRVANLDVLAIRYELPQAEADILTAGLRNNPLLYADAQLVPYQPYNDARPGGPVQYDVNITYPLDVSHKRQARVGVACAAKKVLEAQFQDVSRRQIGNLYHAFVDLQSARIGLLALEAMIRKQEDILGKVRRDEGPTKPTRLERDRLVLELAKSRAGLGDARDALADAQESLGLLLALPEDRVSGLMPRGRLRVPRPPAPSLEELQAVAKQARPDLAAARLGIRRADAEIRLAQANRIDDVYLFYDPITYQDISPFRSLSARSWGLGLTVPVPIFNRNQGNIAKAKSNLSQTHAELAALERRVAAEVRQAYREFVASGQSLELVETSVVAPARDASGRAIAGFLAGELEVGDYLDQMEDEADSSRLHRDAVLRYRRSMLDLDTAVGVRVMP